MPVVCERKQVRLTTNLTGGFRRETLEGRPHLVVGGAILGEEVIHGSDGPIFYPKEENAKDVDAWNHIPIVVYHPKENGAFITARRPDVVNSRKVGVLFNTAHDDKLRPEFWFDEDRLKAVDGRIHDAILNSRPVEVSTGLSAEVDLTPGEFNGKKYTGVARNYRPDHVAILPDQVGAFSVKMGGGLFANQMKTQPESTAVALDRAVQVALSRLKVEMVGNELSFSDVTSQLSDLLAAKYGEPGKYWQGCVCEVFTGYVIFRKDYGYSDRKEFMIGYTVKDDQVSLTGGEKEVERKVEYQVVNEAAYVLTDGVLSPKEVSVSQPTFDKKAHVTALIGNGQIKEADRAKFEAMDDGVLQAIQVVKPAEVKVEKKDDPPVVANQQTKTVVNLADLEPNIRRQVERGLAGEKREKEAYVKTIMANAANPFTEVHLMGKDVDELAGLARLAGAGQSADDDPRFLPGQNPGNWYGAAGVHPGVTANTAPLDDSPLVMPDAFAPAAK